MTSIPLFQVDAFTSNRFEGNPAAVCPLNEWLSPSQMQQIASENNLSETAFFVKNGNQYDIRWFTPENEIDLCGHATLASAHVLFEHLGYEDQSIIFESHISGQLIVSKNESLYQMDFPAWEVELAEVPEELLEALDRPPVAVYRSQRDFLVLYESEEDIKAIEPKFHLIKKIENASGIIITAKGEEVDFVSRFFAPDFGVDEDPVTGSAHCTLIPFWANRLKKNILEAKQLSARGGEIHGEFLGERVLIAGSAVTVIKGELYL